MEDLKVGDWVVPIPEKVSKEDNCTCWPQRQFTRGQIKSTNPTSTTCKINWKLAPDQTRWSADARMLWSTMKESVMLETPAIPDTCVCDFSRGNWSCRCGVGAREISDREASS